MTRRRSRSKKYTRAQNIGQRGVNLVERIVLEMRFVWNPIHFEAGIDGQIEIADPHSGEATNKIVQVQVKSVERDFQSETDNELSYSCERAHIRYWTNGTAPVILVVCRPASNEAYWIDVKRYFGEEENRDSCTVRFNKEANKFDSSSASEISRVAAPEGGLHLGPLPKPETLISNLFPLEVYPEFIHYAETQYRDRDEFVEKLKPLDRPDLREWMLKDKFLYSFHNIHTTPLSELCEIGTAERIHTDDWAFSSDPSVARDFIRLLNTSFGSFCYDRGLSYDRDTHLTFFTAPQDGSSRSIQCQSLEKKGTRKVVERYSVKDDDERTYYYRHHAFKGRFLRFRDKWYLEVTPTYYFSSDGRKLFDYAEDMQSGIKRIERHRAVLGNLLMWKSVLSDQELYHKYKRLRFGPPVEFTVDVGIDDEAWRRSGDELEDFTDPAEVSAADDDEEYNHPELW